MHGYSGEIGFDLNYYAVKLSAKSVSDITKYNDITLTGATSGVVATVLIQLLQMVQTRILFL